MLNTVLHGDCLELMKDIPDGSVDMILCDLPYGTTRNHWDSIIPLDFLWNQYKRIIKDDGAIALTAQTPFDKILGFSNLQMLKYEWIWVKNRGTNHMNVKYSPLKVHENVLIFTKARVSNSHLSPKKPIIYNPQGVIKREKEITRKYNRSVNYIASYGQKNFREGEPGFDGYGVSKTTNYPKDVLEFECESGLHPTQKPVALFEYLIKTYTNEGDTVLDNCAGSFTTSVACDNTKRQWICIDQEKEYCEIGFDRINENRKKINLPLLKSIGKTIVL